LPRSSTGPPTAFAIQSGLQIRLWTAGMTTPSFSNVLSSAQPLRSYNASPGSQDPRIWIQLDSASLLVLWFQGQKEECPVPPPPKKKGHFSRDHMRWWWWWFTTGIRSEKYCFFLGRQRSPEGPCKPCLERPLANTIPWTDEISRDLQGIGFL
jgi:hypothetical protein